LNNWVTLGREVIVAHGASRISLAAAGAAFWLVIKTGASRSSIIPPSPADR
jgi:hypothetical protein